MAKRHEPTQRISARSRHILSPTPTPTLLISWASSSTNQRTGTTIQICRLFIGLCAFLKIFLFRFLSILLKFLFSFRFFFVCQFRSSSFLFSYCFSADLIFFYFLFSLFFLSFFFLSRVCSFFLLSSLLFPPFIVFCCLFH